MPLVTLAEVVRFALPAGTSVLAGAAGLTRPVAWARLLRARPASLGSVEQGEIWLVSPGALTQAGDPRAMSRLVRAAVEAGVIAFVLSEPPNDEALQEAERVETPILLLPAGIAVAEAERAIVAFIVDRDRAVGERVREVYDRLLATLMEDRGTELLAAIVHEVSDKAVYLMDEHFQPTVQAGGDSHTAAAVAEVRRRLWEGAPSGSVGERPIAYRAPDARETLSTVVRPLVLRGAVEGYLALVGRRDDFGDFDYRVADRAASVLAIEIAKQSAFMAARLRVQRDFLDELLDQLRPASDELLDRASGLGYDLRSPHAPVVLRLHARQNAPLGDADYQRFLDVVRRRLVLQNPATLLREREGGVQVLVPCPSDVDHHQPSALTAWVERLRADLAAALPAEERCLVAGVGRTPDGVVVTYHAALREATQAAEIAASLPGGAATLHFAQLGALRLIFQLVGSPELHAFQRDVLGPLDAYDRQHRSDFVQTLDAFFRAGGNHMQAARDLHVHRNTLIYRLERIRDLLGGADLENPDTRLNLQLALKIRHTIGSSPSLPSLPVPLPLSPLGTGPG